jgi:hypothetical protein
VFVAGLNETVAGIVDPSEVLFKSTVDDVTEPASMDSLNVMPTVVLIETPAVPAAGETVTTVGGVASGAPAVVKTDETLAASEFPARSLAPVVAVSV